MGEGCCGGLEADPPAAGGQRGFGGEVTAGGKGSGGSAPQRSAIFTIFQQK